MVALADTMSTASAFAARRGEQVRGNQEMIGIGAANIAAGFFHGFPVSTSGSRTRSRNRLVKVPGNGPHRRCRDHTGPGLASSAMQDVPPPTLGAIVIAAALSLADVAGTRRLWRQRRIEFTLSIIALLGVALLGVLPGILVAVGLHPNVFRRAWWPHHVELVGRGNRRPPRHREVSRSRGIARSGRLPLRRAAHLRERASVRHGLAGDRRGAPDLRRLVVAAEPITDVDATASDMLQELDVWLNERGVSLIFAEMKDPVREKIERYELTRRSTPRTSSGRLTKPLPRTCGDGCRLGDPRGGVVTTRPLLISQSLKEDEDRAKDHGKAGSHGTDGVRGSLRVGNQIEQREAHDQEDDEPLDPFHLGLVILPGFTDYSNTLPRV